MSEIEVKFKILGRFVPLERIGDLQLKVTMGNAATEVKRKLDTFECPDHGKTPHVEISGLSPVRLEYRVEGCCDALVSRARAALRRG